MTEPRREPTEDGIRRAFDRGDLQGAATLLIEAYGAEIFGFLATRLRDRAMTSEVFSAFAEDLWRGLGGFRWNCSVRAWAYTLARHAASREIRRRRRQVARSVPLSVAGPLSQIAERIRSQTSTALQSQKRNRMTELKEQLPEFEQTLLLLRVNRGLPWLDIARIMANGPLEAAIDLSPERLNAEATRLRKRFQKAKEKLRRLAEDAGLLSE